MVISCTREQKEKGQGITNSMVEEKAVCDDDMWFLGPYARVLNPSSLANYVTMDKKINFSRPALCKNQNDNTL